ncbi:MAG: radical SAM protein [Parcubacteria group bacterium]|nr:radical SAM protein [Parcubacteria group bacterium]
MDKYKVSLSRIKELHVEMGYQCNLRCIMCFQCDYTQKLNPNVWQKKLLPLYSTLEKMTIQGGEITVIPECRDLVKLVLEKNPNIKFGAMSNGVLFNEYWQKLFVDHGYMINLSLNAANKETHEKINKNSIWEKVIGNLKAVIDLRNQKKSPLEVYTSFVILPQNIRQLADFIELGKGFGVDKIRFFFDAVNLEEDTKLVEKEVGKALDVARKYKDSLAVEGLIYFYQYYCNQKKVKNIYKDEIEPLIPQGNCNIPFNNLYVDRAAKALVCCMSNLVLGDMNKDSLEEVWNGKRAQLFRKMMQKGDYRYCQATCPSNKKPSYSFDLAKLRCYIDKIKYEYMQSPKTTLKKIKRKIKQFV